MDDGDLERLIARMRSIGDGRGCWMRSIECGYEWEAMASDLRAYCHYRAGVACPTCRGAGERSYASTSTWRGGIGGQAFTVGVCDRCWGTGRTDRQGANLRRLYEEMEDARRTTFVDHLRRRIHETGMEDLPVIADRLDRCRWQTRDTTLMQTVRLLAAVLREAADHEGGGQDEQQ